MDLVALPQDPPSSPVTRPLEICLLSPAGTQPHMHKHESTSIRSLTGAPTGPSGAVAHTSTSSCPTGARKRLWAGHLHMAASHPHWQRHPEAVKPVLGPTTPTGTLEDQAAGGSWLPLPPISDTRAHLYCLHLPRLRAPMFQEELN